MKMINWLKRRFSLFLIGLLIGSAFFMQNSSLSNAETYPSLHNPVVNSCWGTTWNTVYFGNYYQSDTTGKKKEPILWRVLQVKGHDAFLIADKNLDTIPFHSEEKVVTWESSSLRNWLNTTFLNTAFTKQEQSAIIETNVLNANNSFWGTSGGKTTKDKVYLLSLSEASQTSYGFYSDPRQNNYARKAWNTPYLAKKWGMNATQYGDCWWLRTPGYYSSYTTRVNENGYIDIYGMSSISKKIAVRPVIHLNLGYYKYWKKGPDVNSKNDISFSLSVNSSSTPKTPLQIVSPGRVSIVSVSKNQKKKTVKIKYRKQKTATGYQIQYATNKNFKGKKTQSCKKTSITLKKLKRKKYYIRIRAYTSKGSTTKYGKWSKIKSVKFY